MESLPREPIRQYTPNQLRIGLTFQHVLDRIHHVTTVLQREHVDAFFVSTESGRSTVDHQFLKGMGLISLGLYRELCDEGEKETADDVVMQTKKHYGL